ncbi:MAG: hypothetical protein PVG14_13755, partial [Anaerolineales bacterium]
GRRLTLEAYEQSGGVLGALSRRAEEIYTPLDETGREATRQIFLRLVTLGEGVEDTRRRVLRSEVVGLNVERSTVETFNTVLDTFGRHRLLTFDHDPVTREPTVEVAHEALLREWPRLRGWLDESREDIRMQRLLAAATTEWLRVEKDAGFLLRGSRLDQFESWAAETGLALTANERAFLDSSLEERKARQAAETERQAREAALEQRSRRFLRALVGVFAAAALVAVILSVVAFNQRSIAQDNAMLAGQNAATATYAQGQALFEAATATVAQGEAQFQAATAQAERFRAEELSNARATAQSEAEAAEREALRQASIGLAALAEDELVGVDLELGVLLALEAVENYPYTPQAVGALAKAVEQYRAFRTFDASDSVAALKIVATWSPDGRKVAAGANPSTDSVVIWDSDTGSELLTVNTHEQICADNAFQINDLVWSPSGNRLAAAAQGRNFSEACKTVVLDTTSGDTLLTIADNQSASRSLDWSPNGAILLSGHEDGSVRLWDADTGEEISILSGHAGTVRDAVFSPDGSRIASASEDGTVRLWDAETGTEQKLLSGHAGPVRSVDWSPDGTRLITGGDDGLPRVWDVASGETRLVLPGHTAAVVIVTWSADGRRLASQSLDGTVNIWDAATGGLIFQIPNVAPDPESKRGFVEFSPDGNWILAGATRVLGIRIWDTSTSVPKLFGHTFGQEWGGWSPDRNLIATSGTDGSARLWDAKTGLLLKEFNQGSYWGDWSPDGSRLVLAEGVGAFSINVWDVSSGEILSSLSYPKDDLGNLRFLTMDWSPDGAFITAAGLRLGTPQAVYVWDAETYELVSTLQTDGFCMLGWPHWSPDSTKIATGCIFVESGTNTPARIWDAATGREIMRLESQHGLTYRTVWSPDGKRLLTAYEDGTVVIWDLETGEPILTFTETQGPAGGDWSPDGKLIVSNGYGTPLVKIRDAETGEELMSFSVPGNVLTTGWSPDGTHVIVTGDGITVPVIKRVWRSTDELVTHAYECCVTRELTPEERQQFGLPPQP